MKLITRTQKAVRVEHRWYESYSNSTFWDSCTPPRNKTKRQIHEDLVALGSFPTADQVDEVIGNKSWTECRCDECGKQAEQVVQLGQDPDYESSTACICLPCLKKAVKLK